MDDSCAKIFQDDHDKPAFNISVDIEDGPKTFQSFIKLNFLSAEANDTGRTETFIMLNINLKRI